MPQNLAELRQMLSRGRPWIVVAVTLAVVLLGYYLVQGWRYWQASGDVSSLTQEISKIQGSINRFARAADKASADTDEQVLEQQRTEEELRSLFSEQSVENLMTIVADTAVKAAVNLTSMTPDATQSEIFGELQYQVQPLSIAVEGDTADLYRFLSLLHGNVPVVSVLDIRIANLEGRPSARVQLRFYLSPGPVEATEEAG